MIEGYQTRLTGLTETEIRALLLATLAGPPSELGMTQAFEDALLKVSAALPESSRYNADFTRQRFHVDAAWWYANSHGTPCLQTIQEAVWQNRTIFMHYCEEDGRQQSYLVESYGLVTKAGIWYLIGMYENKQHVFRVSRISHVEMTAFSFTRLADFNLAMSWEAYRIQLETNCPSYASALRLAPDEIHALLYVLSEWGYTQVERDKTIPIRSRSRRPRQRSQQKKQFINPRAVIKKRGPSTQKKGKWPLKKRFYFFTSLRKTALRTPKIRRDQIYRVRSRFIGYILVTHICRAMNCTTGRDKSGPYRSWQRIMSVPA